MCRPVQALRGRPLVPQSSHPPLLRPPRDGRVGEAGGLLQRRLRFKTILRVHPLGTRFRFRLCKETGKDGGPGGSFAWSSGVSKLILPGRSALLGGGVPTR